MAAAAYRAGARLTDARTGRTYDYGRKQHIVATAILTPDDAPAWARDRQQLWNRAEAAERRKDATVWREVEVSLPRDLSRDAWMPLIRDAVRPYLASGSIADVAIHCPPAADGGEQPHAHIMLTTRALDGDGFAVAKNHVLTAIFESGGRNGGKHGEALRRERERWAETINAALRAHGSDRRADHRSRRDRGLGDEPEPTIGERTTARWRRTGQPSRRQQYVGLMRARRKTEHAQLATEVAMIDGLYNGKKQGVKAELLRKRMPDFPVGAYKDQLHMVDVSQPGRTRVQLEDTSWVEIDHTAGRIRTWGPRDGATAGLARDAADALGWDHDTIERLPEVLRAGGQSTRRLNSKPIAEEWRQRGYTDVYAGRDGCWVTIGQTRLHDTGDRVALHGPVTDDALKAMCTKARESWDGRMQIWGDDTFRARLWMEAQRQGVEITNYEPPAHVRAAWEAEQGRTARAEAAVSRVASAADTARALAAYARGDREEPPTPELGAAVDRMSDAERSQVASAEPYELAPRLAALREQGRQAMADQQAAPVAAPRPVPEPTSAPAAPALTPRI